MSKKILAVLTVALVLGCATTGHKLDQASMDKIKQGVTSKEQVLQILGSPEEISRRSNGEVTYNYKYTRATAKPENFIPIVGLFVGGMDTQNQFFIVTFGPDGIVKDITSTYGATEINTGIGVGEKADMPDVEQNKRAP